MLSVFELYKIVGAWCDDAFGGTYNIESKTSGDGESMRSFYYHCLVGDDPDCYVDIGVKMNGAETCTSIWSHNTDNVHIQLFRDGSVRWNDTDTYYAEFCGEKEIKKLYEIIQHVVISRNNKERGIDKKEQFSRLQVIMGDWLGDIIKNAFRNDGHANLTTDNNHFQWEICKSSNCPGLSILYAGASLRDDGTIVIWTGSSDNVNISFSPDNIVRFHADSEFNEDFSKEFMNQLSINIHDEFASMLVTDGADGITIIDNTEDKESDNMKIVDVNTMEDIRSSALEIAPQFNLASDVLRLGLPYMIRNIKDGTTIIATLRVVDVKKLEFDSWKGHIEIDAKDYHKGDDWKIYPANTKDGGMIL